MEQTDLTVSHWGGNFRSSDAGSDTSKSNGNGLLSCSDCLCNSGLGQPAWSIPMGYSRLSLDNRVLESNSGI